MFSLYKQSSSCCHEIGSRNSRVDPHSSPAGKASEFLRFGSKDIHVALIHVSTLFCFPSLKLHFISSTYIVLLFEPSKPLDNVDEIHIFRTSIQYGGKSTFRESFKYFHVVKFTLFRFLGDTSNLSLSLPTGI